MPIAESTFRERLESVEARIQAAAARARRDRSEIQLVAVSKKFSAEKIIEAHRGGCRDFGENYVQEFAEKAPKVRLLDGVRVHLIGHLQSNKARQACELFDVIQTIDSVRLLHRLNEAAAAQNKTLAATIEVKLGSEESKSGCSPDLLRELLEAARGCRHLGVSGLMTIPPWSEDPEVSRPYFRELARLSRLHGLAQISMGMSNDFEAAIEEGATIIRIGTALFGARPKPAAAVPEISL